MHWPSLITRFHCLIFLVLAAVTILGFATIPADHTFALHRLHNGSADWFWPRNLGLLVLPAAAVLIAIWFAIISWRADKIELDRLRHVLDPALTVLLGLCLALQFGLVLEGRGSDLDLIRVIGFAVGVALVGLGVVLAEAQPKVYGALRLPWAVPPERWTLLHRLTGVLFALGGAALLLAAWLQPYAGPIMIATAVATLLPPLVGRISSRS